MTAYTRDLVSPGCTNFSLSQAATNNTRHTKKRSSLSIGSLDIVNDVIQRRCNVFGQCGVSVQRVVRAGFATGSAEARAGRAGFISRENRFKMTLSVYQNRPRRGKAIPVFTMAPCKG